LNWTGLGLATARRAWLEPKNLLNCQPLDAVREAVSRKRADAHRIR
jgi:hypothetical protein